MPLPLRAKHDGRPYWALLYADGRVVEEPNCDWLDAPRRGRRAVRLYCPDGQTAEFAVGSDGLCLQFKCAEVRTPVGAAEPGSETVEAVAASGARGVWTRPAPPPPERTGPAPPRTGKFTAAYVVGRVVGTDGACECAVWEPYPGRLGFFSDNVNAMRYRSIGALSVEHLGLVRL